MTEYKILIMTNKKRVNQLEDENQAVINWERLDFIGDLVMISDIMSSKLVLAASILCCIKMTHSLCVNPPGSQLGL